MNYSEIRKINVNEHIEKKNGLSYLSWAWAVDQLLQLDESATWEYSEPRMFGDTMMVFCTVTAFGKSRTAQLPVMNYKNQAIPAPDAFQVNTAMQRCLAKAISLHGIGLYIYAGEDLPEDAASKHVKPPKTAQNVTPIQPPRESGKSVSNAVWETLTEAEQVEIAGISEDVKALMGKPTEALQFIHDLELSAEHQTALWSLLDSKDRAALKAAKAAA